MTRSSSMGTRPRRSERSRDSRASKGKASRLTKLLAREGTRTVCAEVKYATEPTPKSYHRRPAIAADRILTDKPGSTDRYQAEPPRRALDGFVEADRG